MLLITESGLEPALFKLLLRYQSSAHRYEYDETVCLKRRDSSGLRLLSQLLQLIEKQWFHEIVHKHLLHAVTLTPESRQQIIDVSNVLFSSMSLLTDRICGQLDGNSVNKLLHYFSTCAVSNPLGYHVRLPRTLFLSSDNAALLAKLKHVDAVECPNRKEMSELLSDLLIEPLVLLNDSLAQCFTSQHNMVKSTQMAQYSIKKGSSTLMMLLLKKLSPQQLLTLLDVIKPLLEGRIDVLKVS